MSIFDKLFGRPRKDQKPAFQWRNTGLGLHFAVPGRQHRLSGDDSLQTYQYIALQQLVESGEARKDRNGFHVESQVLCRLDPCSREILDLPAPWPGRFELEARGTTTRSSFALNLWALPSTGAGRFSCLPMDGPFLIVDGVQYLPDAAQWLALNAVAEHTALAPEERSEFANLLAVRAVQEAVHQGAAIDMRHFADFSVEMVDRVGVDAMETRGGNLLLSPHLAGEHGDLLSPGELAPCLGQLEKEGDEKAVLRVGKALILFDERRLRAAREILNSRIISARERHQFLATPGAYLDASLVDLDLGLSLRVHGMEVYRKAYFGLTEVSSLSWFGDEDTENVLFLPNCLPLLKEEKDLDALRDAVSKARTENRASIDFHEHTVLLPRDSGEDSSVLHALAEALEQKIARETQKEHTDRDGAAEEGTTPVTVKLGENDEQTDTPSVPDTDTQAYQGPLYKEDLNYTFFDYQEVGTRWIAGLMQPFLQGDKECFCGGLLADDMGLGKTFMVLAALNIYFHQASPAKPILAVMPVVLLENWKQEIERVFKTSPFRDVILLQSSAQLAQFRQEGGKRESVLHRGETLPEGNQVRYSLKVGPDFGSERLDMPGRLVLTNYDTLRDYQFSLCLVDWGCVIFDEAQEIRNPNALKTRAAKGLKADFRLAVTGTPVENALSDFWCLYDTVKPGLLGAFQDFRRTCMKPIRDAEDGETRDRLRLEIGKALRDKVDRFLLRRTKEEKLEGLPRKFVHSGVQDERYRATMTGLQLDKYNAVISAVVAAKQSGNPAAVRAMILPSLRRLQMISLHPDFLDGGTPPLCTTHAEIEAFFAQSAKLRLLLDILEEVRVRAEKVILFVISKNMQRFLAYALGMKYGLDISIVNGETRSVPSGSTRRSSRDGARTRIELIREFESREGFQIICMSPLAAGVGLTVLGANNVVHLERHWNPAREAQATDRVYRIGATRDVHVYIPIVQHPVQKSFDVNLDELLCRKTDLKDAVMTTGDVRAEEFDDIFGATLHSERIGPNWQG